MKQGSQRLVGVAVIDIDRVGRVRTWRGHGNTVDSPPENRFLTDIWPTVPDVAPELARVLQGEERHCTWRLAGEDSSIFCLPSEDGASIVVLFAAGPSILERRERAFVEAVNHELRTPLTIISGFAQLLREQGDSAGEARRHVWSETVVTASNRLRLLVDNLLSLLQDKGPASPTVAVKLGLLVRQAIQTIVAGRPDCAIQSAGDPDLRLGADTDTVHSILCRLLENAVDASLVTSITWDVVQDMAAIRVRDDGMGIGSIARAVLFMPFGKEPAYTGTGGRVGLGLSLYLARRAARSLHGDLELESSGPTGTSFLLTLPLAGSRVD